MVLTDKTMDFKSYLRGRCDLVNKVLDELLPPADKFPARVNSAMRYSLFGGGKRVRPILTLGAVDALGGDIKKAMNTASALECIHTYSLIHDDLPAMDDDDLRRGNPTCHKKFDEATAILAGDGLLTLAFELIADTKDVAPEVIVKVVKEVSGGAGVRGMVGGQIIDMESEGADLNHAELQNIHIHKTGKLIVASVRCGAVLSDATDSELEKLTEYGECIGLSFQIADDILDVTGDSIELGKTAGKDEVQNKATYPSIMGLSESKKLAEDLTERALGALSDFDEKADPLRSLAKYIVERTN